MTTRTAVIVGVLATAGAALGAQTVTPIPENYYAAGETVTVPAPVLGDAIVAGRIVTIDQRVSGDVLAAGWHVHVSAPTDDDVRAAGAEVQITAPVDGDLTVAAGDLTIGREARIGGRTWLTGRTVRADGAFAREVRIAAEHVLIGGDIDQPIRIVAQRLDVLPTARVRGAITYEGATPATIAAGAQVTQPITYRNIPAEEARQARWPRGISSLVFGIHVFFGGLLLLLLVPRLAGKPATVLRERPAQSLFAGLALVVTIPVVALLLMISVVGFPAGLALGAAYAAALFIGVVTTALFIGAVEEKLLKLPPASTMSRRAAMLLAGVMTLMALRALPVLGTLVVFSAVVVGLGALGVWSYQTYRQAAV